ncbi:DUF423 domain-containing protein [Oleiagrimonas sp. C23AA]|uniref:DUF423 domain-containing protein n=1 Tax=Oleiagrimonas sp. C23AA TaxID=2719047 RepID=UPI0031B72544
MRQHVPAWQAVWLAALGASAVICGAFGAHALAHSLDARQMQVWHTSVDYHFWHALAFALAVVAAPVGRARSVCLVAFAFGVLAFSGSLYALALGAPRWVGIITPFGGTAFIVGWIAFGVAMWPRRDR